MGEIKKTEPAPMPPPILIPMPGHRQHWVNMQARGAIKGTERFGYDPGLQVGKTAPFCIFYLCFLKRDNHHKITETNIKCIAFQEVAEWIVANLKYGDTITIIRAEPFNTHWRSKTGQHINEIQWNVYQIDIDEEEPELFDEDE